MISVPFIFTPDTTADANQVNANFAAVVAGINAFGSAPFPISSGGTGATTAQGALSNLGAQNIAIIPCTMTAAGTVLTIVPIAAAPTSPVPPTEPVLYAFINTLGVLTGPFTVQLQVGSTTQSPAATLVNGPKGQNPVNALASAQVCYLMWNPLLNSGAGYWVLVNQDSGFGLRSVAVFAVAGGATFTPAATTELVVIEMWGGDGGGGGAASNDSSHASAGGGGDAGAYCCALLTTGFGTPAAGVSVTVGAAGAAGSAGANAGGDGGDTSFAGTVIAKGGKGGAAGATVTPPAATTVNAGTLTGSGANVIQGPVIPGTFPGLCLATTLAIGGSGGTPARGVGHGGGPVAGTAPGNAFAVKGGGGGAAVIASGTQAAGAAGGAGLIIVWQYG